MIDDRHFKDNSRLKMQQIFFLFSLIYLKYFLLLKRILRISNNYKLKPAWNRTM